MKNRKQNTRKQNTIEIVAGPNGSGKTTFAETFFKRKNGRSIYINPDIIAAGLSPNHTEHAAFQAGRVMISSIKETIERSENFAFESTLSGKTWLPILIDAKEAGFQITIYFLFLERVQENIRRIQKRVKEGGHLVPSLAVKRRYPRTFFNFWELYRPLCSNWFIFNNSATQPKLVHSKASFENLRSQDQEKFAVQFLKGKTK